MGKLGTTHKLAPSEPPTRPRTDLVLNHRNRPSGFPLPTCLPLLPRTPFQSLVNQQLNFPQTIENKHHGPFLFDTFEPLFSPPPSPDKPAKPPHPAPRTLLRPPAGKGISAAILLGVPHDASRQTMTETAKSTLKPDPTER